LIKPAPNDTFIYGRLIFLTERPVLFYLDEDIDGGTLALLQHNDIVQIFPRIKDRVKFVDQRAKLILNFNEQDENNHGTRSNQFDSTSSLQPEGELEENGITDSFVSNKSKESINQTDQITDPNVSSDINSSDDIDNIYTKVKLSDDYEGPDLTIRMLQYVDENDISKFNPHTSMRSELLSLLFDDVTKSHQLL